MNNKGFTLIGLLIVIAILAIIAVLVIPSLGDFGCLNITGNETATNETTTDNAAIFKQLSSEPITSLNLTELNFMVDYCMTHVSATDGYMTRNTWANIASVYQNQIIILLLESETRQ